MDNKAIRIVLEYIIYNLSAGYIDTDSKLGIYIVWKAKALQNWKYLISTNLCDGMYYELTYNGDKKEWYMDVYKKIENRVIVES